MIDSRYGDGGSHRNDLVNDVSSDIDAGKSNRPMQVLRKGNGSQSHSAMRSWHNSKSSYRELVMRYVDRASETLSLLVSSTVICLGLLRACDVPFLLISFSLGRGKK
jgi:hypothetical protein